MIFGGEGIGVSVIWIVFHCVLHTVKPWSRLAAGAYSGVCSMKWLGVFLLTLDGMLVHRRSFSRNLLGFPNNSPVHIYIPGWREALRIKCLAQEHNTMSQARARTRTARSGGERTNHEATAPPQHGVPIHLYFTNFFRLLLVVGCFSRSSKQPLVSCDRMTSADRETCK